ncbi:MAG TPA: hypothetical protein ENJ09_08685, partial [Planctomycetes bacterium]|nr:hypothetical protein [Planctomycetota bacterium]
MLSGVEHPAGTNRIVRAAPAGLLTLVLLACGGSVLGGEGGGHGVLVVAVDGLRADHLGSFGYDRDTSPNLDALARSGVSFRDALACSPLTLPSHIGLLSGTEPFLAQRRLREDFGFERWNLAPRLPSLAVEFLAAGWRTAAFLGTPELGEVEGLRRGFLEWSTSKVPFDPEEVGVRRLLAWVRGQRDRNWFAYIELADLSRAFGRSWTRAPSPWERYFEPRPSLSEIPPVASTDDVFFAIPNSSWRGGARPLGEYEALYDGEVRRVDAEIGAIIAGLRRLGLEETTTLAVVGVNGMQFGEAGLYLRSGLYSPADLRVPFLLRLRAGHAGTAGTVVRGLVSGLDLAPTLLESEGIAIPAGMRGVSRLAEALGRDEGAHGPRRVFVSCGLLGGGAVFEGSHAYELTLPGQLQKGSLRRSWFGALEPDAGALPVVRAYDFEETAFPP